MEFVLYSASNQSDRPRMNRTDNSRICCGCSCHHRDCHYDSCSLPDAIYVDHSLLSTKYKRHVLDVTLSNKAMTRQQNIGVLPVREMRV